MDLFELKRFAIVTVGSRTALYFFSEEDAHEMDRRRQVILNLAHSLNPNIPRKFYRLDR